MKHFFSKAKIEKLKLSFLAFAMDLTPLAHDDSLDIVAYVTGAIDRFRDDVVAKLRDRLSK